VQRCTLTVGSRSIPVDPNPLPVFKSNFRTQSLRRESDRVLILSPSAGSRAFALPFLLFGAFAVLGAVTNAVTGQEPLGLTFVAAFVGVPLLAIGLASWILPLRFEFDTAAGRLRMSRPGARRQRPLRDVLALQLLEIPKSRRMGITYQLNLVLDDERQPRVNLSNHTDRDFTREVARELQWRLGVPLLE
jgi:hypothetical protein